MDLQCKISISESQIDRLMSWFGYGDLKNADIIFLGNEEGLGGVAGELESVLQGRAEVLGNNPRCWLGNNRKNGCWEISAYEADVQLRSYTNKLKGIHTNWEPFTKSEMLQFQARMLLAIENENGEWFKKKDESPENYCKINEFVGESLYSPNAKVKSFLMDLRFLPRANESYWPFESIDRDKYLKAFSYSPREMKNEYFQKYARPRAEILKKAIETSSAKVIVGIGDKNAKKNFFEMFVKNGWGEINFVEETLSTCKIYSASANIGDRKVSILLSPFFSSYGKNLLRLAGLKELTERFVRPALK